MKDKEFDIDFALVQTIAKYFIKRNCNGQEYISIENAMKDQLMKMVCGGGASGLFNQFNETETKQVQMTTAVSVICKKCNHVMYNHVRYGKTDWNYCKTCLKSKKKSECV